MKLINSYLYKEIEINKVDQNKTLFLKTIVNQLTFHKKNCQPYCNFINNLNLKLNKLYKIQDIPFLHVNVFKEKDLESDFEKQFSELISDKTKQEKLSKNIEALALVNATNDIVNEVEKLLKSSS